MLLHSARIFRGKHPVSSRRHRRTGSATHDVDRPLVAGTRRSRLRIAGNINRPLGPAAAHVTRINIATAANWISLPELSPKGNEILISPGSISTLRWRKLAVRIGRVRSQEDFIQPIYVHHLFKQYSGLIWVTSWDTDIIAHQDIVTLQTNVHGYKTYKFKHPIYECSSLTDLQQVKSIKTENLHFITFNLMTTAYPNAHCVIWFRRFALVDL